MADPFTPKFVDLVRNFTTTAGTGDLVLGDAVPGFTGFTEALQPGDQFYYSAAGILRTDQSEVGRGTLTTEGGIAREPIGGVLTDFPAGLKSVALVVAAEWFGDVHNRTGDGDAGDITQHVGDRIALAAASTSDPAAVLREPGREGLFIFDATDISADVSDSFAYSDIAQGIYVLPDADLTGASGAWVRQYDGPAFANWWGAAASASASSNAAAIQAALDHVAARGGGTLRGLHGEVVDTDATLSVPEKVGVDLDGMTINVIADVDGVRLRRWDSIGNGTIALAFTGTTKAALLLNGSDKPNDAKQARCHNMSLVGTGTGDGLRLQVDGVDGDLISWCRFQASIRGFENGLVINVDDPGSGVTWANENIFDLTIYDCVNFIVCSRDHLTRTAINGNRITASIQPNGASLNAMRTMVMDGEKNDIRLRVWDSNKYSPSNGGVFVDFTAKSGENRAVIGHIAPHQIVNRDQGGGLLNQIITYGSGALSTAFYSTPPMSPDNPVAAGVQDDYIAFATLRSGWTVTASVAPSTGSLANIFDPLPSNFAQWTALNGTVELLVDMGAVVTYPTGIGMAFLPALGPDSFKLEMSVDNVTWETLVEQAGPRFFYHKDTYFIGVNPRYLRLTFATTSAKDVQLNRFFANFYSQRGNAWLAKDGGGVLGALDFTHATASFREVRMSGVKVVGDRKTGWAADTSFAKRTSNASYSAGSAIAFSDPPTAAEMSALVTRLGLIELGLQNVSRTQKAIKDDLISHGLIGT